MAFRKHRVEAEQQGVAHQRRRAALTERLAGDAAVRAHRRAAAGDRRRSARRWPRPRPMNVLLQGDVGAGKTLVALHAALVAIQSGHQAAIMAPTEVLAGQHLRSVAALLEGVGGGAVPRPRGAKPAADDGQASLLDAREPRRRTPARGLASPTRS